MPSTITADDMDDIDVGDDMMCILRPKEIARLKQRTRANSLTQGKSIARVEESAKVKRWKNTGTDLNLWRENIIDSR